MQITYMFRDNPELAKGIFKYISSLSPQKESDLISDEEIVKKIKQIQENNAGMTLSTLLHVGRHMKDWGGYQGMYPFAIPSLKWLDLLDPENGLPMIVITQEDNCMSGLNGRSLNMLRKILRSKMLDVKSGKIQLSNN